MFRFWNFFLDGKGVTLGILVGVIDRKGCRVRLRGRRGRGGKSDIVGLVFCRDGRRGVPGSGPKDTA